MALPKDVDLPIDKIRSRHAGGVTNDIIGWGPITLTTEVAEPISAIFAHFLHEGGATQFALLEDAEAGLTIVEVESGLTGDEFWAYYTTAIDWWLDQPRDWHDHVHLAVW